MGYKNKSSEAAAKWNRDHRLHRNDMMRKRKRALRAKLSEMRMRVGCARCGNKDPRVLVYHHTDPKTKSFTIGNQPGYHAFSKLEKEIAKCVVLCANCHLISHVEARDQEAS